MNDAAPIDLSRLDVKPRAQEGVEMPLLGPDGLPTGAFLRVRGVDSRAYQQKLEEQIRAKLERGGRKQTQEERDDEFWDSQGVLVIGWRPSIVMAAGEQALAWSQQNAVRLLREQPYIWEQVLAFSRERANFLPGSASSSSAT